MDKKNPYSNSSRKIIAGIAAILVIILLAYFAFFGETAVVPLNPQQNDTEKPNSTTSSPLPTTQPMPNSTTPSVDITYNVLTKPSIGWNWSSDFSGYVQSDPGKVFLVVNLTIRNNGYEEFSTNPYYFDAVADGVRYGFDNRTWNFANWEPLELTIGETYSGTLVFQIPATTQSVTVDYVRENHKYTINWTKI